MTPDDPRHGTNAGYIQHCLHGIPTCQPCRDAHSAYKRAARNRRVLQRVDRFHTDATGTRRRIRALIRMGWRYRDMDRWLGNTSATAHNLNRTDTHVVHIDTARRIAQMYDALSMRPGPSPRNRKLGEKWGWAPPLAWDDDTIDDPNAKPAGLHPLHRRDDYIDEAAVLRSMGGERIQLTKAERTEVVSRLLARKWSHRQIADHTGLKVDRYAQPTQAQHAAEPDKEEVAA